MNKSPLAIQKPAKRRRFRKIDPWGLGVHTTGRGILARAHREDMEPIEAALKWYRAIRRSGVHYVTDYDGCIYQMLDDNIRGAHIGLSRRDRQDYLSGRWTIGQSAEALAMWRARWPGKKSPQHLYPTRSPNGCYVGVELLPLAAEDVGDDGLWFTPAQHVAVRNLAWDLAHRHRWPEGWQWSARLLGHEDLTPHSRWQLRGGWDPGALRDIPRFGWARVRGATVSARV